MSDSVSNMMPCEFLSLEDLLDIVSALKIGPVRDLGLLNAAALRPQTTLMGQDAYPSTAAKAAALLESLTKNHALIDGNKRLGGVWVFRTVCFERVVLSSPGCLWPGRMDDHEEVLEAHA